MWRCQERSKLSSEVAKFAELLEAGSPVRSYLCSEAMPVANIHTVIYMPRSCGICRPICYEC